MAGYHVPITADEMAHIAHAIIGKVYFYWGPGSVIKLWLIAYGVLTIILET